MFEGSFADEINTIYQIMAGRANAPDFAESFRNALERKGIPSEEIDAAFTTLGLAIPSPAYEGPAYESKMKPVHELNPIIESVQPADPLTKSVFSFLALNEMKGQVRQSRSKDAVEYFGTAEDLVEAAKAINKELMLTEGKRRPMGSMSKYSRCFPIRGGGKLFFAFK
jgi:hypothetical protein